MYKKLLAVQKEIGKISKDSTNPFFKSKYFDINALLDAVKPVLSDHGLLLLQPLTHIDGQAAIKTMLIEVETGDMIDVMTPLTENSDPQKMGSAITYYRRYSLQSLLGLQAEDDDGNKASGKKKKVESKFKPETTVQSARDRIRKGFDILKYSAEKQAEMVTEYLDVSSVGDSDDLENLNFLLENLVKKAKR